MLDFIDDQGGASFTESFCPPCDGPAEDTGVGTAAAGDNADGIAERLIAGQGKRRRAGKGSESRSSINSRSSVIVS